MDFSTKVSVKLLLQEVEKGETKNMLTSPLSYNTIINMIAAGTSHNTLDQILLFLERKNIQEVNSDSLKFAEIITSEQTTKHSSKQKIESVTDSNMRFRQNIQDRQPNSTISGSPTTLHGVQKSLGNFHESSGVPKKYMNGQEIEDLLAHKQLPTNPHIFPAPRTLHHHVQQPWDWGNFNYKKAFDFIQNQSILSHKPPTNPTFFPGPRTLHSVQEPTNPYLFTTPRAPHPIQQLENSYVYPSPRALHPVQQPRNPYVYPNPRTLDPVQQPLGNFQEGFMGFPRKYQENEVGNGPIISSLNGVWVNKDYVLNDSFQELVENLYKAKVRSIDCSKPKMVVQETNEWATASTKGLIKEVLQESHITPTTVFILGNSLYFKGSWEEAFNKQSTMDFWFYLPNGEKIGVPFMTGCKKYSHKFFQNFQVARIPYKVGGHVKRRFAMYIFLPNERDGLKTLLQNVNSDPEFFNKHCDLSFGETVDTFYIPKFKFSYLTTEGSGIMERMGLTLPFDPEKAEYYEMIIAKEQRLHVSTIIQKAFIEVNEEGTEAAAVTFALSFGGSSMKRTYTQFIADHPFMFIIREENSGILFFCGTFLNPLEV